MALTNVEATVVAKGTELTHGNSAHYVTFELENGERLFFQVSIKIYMLVIEGDHCLIEYKDSAYGKKKLKSFERIGKNLPVAMVSNHVGGGLVAESKPASSGATPRHTEPKQVKPLRESGVEPKKSFEPVKKLKATSTKTEISEIDEDVPNLEQAGYKPHKLLQKLDSFKANDTKKDDDGIDWEKL